ncbi:MAG: endonuclease/exonuclease/phosphatase family protein [Archangium sp.]
MIRVLVVAAFASCCAAKPGAVDAGLRIASLNTANGAGDHFRLPAVRARQTELLTGIDVAALQEVDVGVMRSGDLNTAAHAAGLADCSPSPLTEDGVLRCTLGDDTVVFGVALAGGIPDTDDTLNPTGVDTRPTAFYGNAVVVRGRAVESAVVVALPGDVEPSLERYAPLVDAPPDTLAAHNRDVRATARIEARAVLVVRLAQPKVSVLALHLEAGDEAALRQSQLGAALAIAQRERAKGRSVVVLGDFNMSPADAAAAFTDSGFSKAVGDGVNHIWVDSTLRTSQASEVPTDGGSDHLLMPVVLVRPG